MNSIPPELQAQLADILASIAAFETTLQVMELDNDIIEQEVDDLRDRVRRLENDS